MKRSVVRAVCQALLGVFLFTQMALSVYACPALLGADTRPQLRATNEVAAVALDRTSLARMAVDCAERGATDRDFANLCDAHGRYGQQTDHTAQLVLPGAVMMSLYPASVNRGQIAPGPRVQTDAAGSRAILPLPHAIVHCCFRI